MNKTTILTVVAVLTAAALIGTFASPAFASGSSTNVFQQNNQKQIGSGFINFQSQRAQNCINIIALGCAQ